MKILDTMVTKCLGVLQTYYTFVCFSLCCGFTKILPESSGTTLHHHQGMLAVVSILSRTTANILATQLQRQVLSVYGMKFSVLPMQIGQISVGRFH
jgi:hypothetical protein